MIWSILIIMMYLATTIYFMYLTYDAARNQHKKSYWIRLAFTVYFVIRTIMILMEVL